MFLTFPINRINSVSYLIEQIPNWKELDAIFISALSNFETNDDIWTSKEVSNEASDEYLLSMSCGLKKIRFDMWTIDWIEFDGCRKYFSSSPLGKSAYISYAKVA